MHRAFKSAPWLVNDYFDSIGKSLGSSSDSRYRRLLQALTRGPLSFAELARRVPDPPKQIARDVFDMAEQHLVEMESEGPDTTRVEITAQGKELLGAD